ncbi:MAG: hypothetical protein P8H41_03565, partial [Schleiferiaceae bacterium]|nr:hypothetical protein [Schleiferiaceae bacterium]
MKPFFSLLSLCLSSVIYGQSLTLNHVDTLVVINPNSMSVGEGHIELLNVDTIANDYYLKIARVGSTGLVDSNAFCFDLCYGAGAVASMGTVNIASGAVSYDFA